MPSPKQIQIAVFLCNCSREALIFYTYVKFYPVLTLKWFGLAYKNFSHQAFQTIKTVFFTQIWFVYHCLLSLFLIILLLISLLILKYQIFVNSCCHNRFSWFWKTHVGESSWNVLHCAIYSNGKQKITILTFTHWKRFAPFSFIACDRGGTNSCEATGTRKLYRLPMPEVLALYSTMRWCDGRRTKC